MSFFSARQPILDTDKNIFGYELLFRISSDNIFPDVDEEAATSKMIEGLQFDLGLDKIASGKWAFINFTEQSLLNAYPNMLPKEKVVVEVLETVTPTPVVYKQLQTLAIEGYVIALDDFIHSDAWEPYYKFTQIIKVDCKFISQTELDDILDVKARFPHIKLLAEKIENYKEFIRYEKLGFELFQGYFFAKPEVIKSVSLSSSQSVLSGLLSEVTKKVPNFAQITKLFEIDVALSFKLLRYTQSPIFKRRKSIDNIKQAVVLLGHTELERFVMLLFAATIGEGKPTALIKLSIHRAKFCEQFAERAKFDKEVSSAFLVGMLSLIDAMLDAELEQLISAMPLSDSIKEALVLHQGLLSEFIALCQYCETGDWEAMEAAGEKYNITLDELLTIYQDAELWANERLSALK
ncbi:EAL and HDOD domain-containing protein [Glaciecola sp. 2405UD65-10]|uniref:EAL and HDOD domain-containing protein n=1 Tax=Glaciecola sp. 2405UD65-10 TaxID=3397244 RepID=UPI003B5B34E0